MLDDHVSPPWGFFTDEEDSADVFVTDGVFSGWFLMFA